MSQTISRFLPLTRRRFLASAAALAAVGPRAAAASSFPQGFLWGASTSALQVEGGLSEDGRGPSIWDAFGGVADGSSPAVACDHYHRWPEDVALMRQAGFSAYRFSIAWPRVLPDGTGTVNRRGLDFYERLIDGLLEAGIRPMPCLYHWDLPQALQDKGGWMNRDIAAWFAEYAAVVAGRLGDRVMDWFALNEPSTVAIFGHAYADHAPGLNRGKDGVLAALHHQNLAQGQALRALRAAGSHFRLGTVLSLQPVRPVSQAEADRQAAIRWDAMWNRVSLDGVLRGRLPDALADDLAAWVKPGDLEKIWFPLDRVGLNYYSPLTIGYQPGRLFDAGFGPSGNARTTAMGWPVEPRGLGEILAELRDLYDNPEVLICENGAAYDDRPDATGRVEDADRTAFLKDHLEVVAAAVANGCNVTGYLAWSLIDNWEWQCGFSQRFGLVRVDYATQKRTPKASFDWYRSVIADGRLDDPSGVPAETGHIP